VTQSRPAQLRQQSLAPFILKLGISCGQGDNDKIPSVLELGEQQLSLDPWERSVLQDSRDGKHGVEQGWAPLLAEGLAFQMKCLHQVEQLRRISSQFDPNDPELANQKDLVQEQMINNGAVGMAVVADIKYAIDQATLDGENTPAKHLSGFLHRIETGVNLLKQFMDEEANIRVENKSEAMINQSVAPSQPHLQETLEEILDLDNLDDMDNLVEAQPEPPKNHLGPLLILLSLLVISWLVFILPRLGKQSLPQLELATFNQISSIQTVTARPPSLYVTLDESSWQAMPANDRLDVLEQTGHLASTAGYTGVHFRVRSGTTVGRWLKKGGASLVQSTNVKGSLPPS